MKKFILLFFIFNINFTSAQCELDFKEILSSLLLNSTEFDTYVLKKGFYFDSELKKYVCNLDNDKYLYSNVIEQSKEGKKLTVTYSTHSKETYLLNKSQVEKTDLEFVSSNIVNNLNVFLYKHNNITATLASETYEDEIIYYISIQILLTE